MIKTASKLSVWHGKNLTQARRATLTKYVLTAQPVYSLTALKPQKEVIDEIDKIRKRFLWARDKMLTRENAKLTGYGLAYLSNWVILGY